jgi:phage recombination protein Bet
MTTAVATREKRALVPKWTKAQLELLKRTVAKGTTDDEFSLFVYTCKRTGLDPFIKQIYAIKRWDSQSNSYVMAIQTGIDGYRLIASRTGELAGIDEPEFVTDPNTPDHPIMATVMVYRFVNGEKCKFVGQARWAEFVQKNKEGEPTGRWKDMPFNQLAKCAEAAAHRKAFPHDLGCVVANEEMPVIDIEAVQETTATPAEQPKAEDMTAGVLVAYSPGDSKSKPKKPHRFTFKTDAGAEITLTAWERPETLRGDTMPLGRRCQFKYEEKRNEKNPNSPYRNLTHFALEEVTPESEPESGNSDGQAAPADEGATAPGDDRTTDMRALLDENKNNPQMLQDLYSTLSADMKKHGYTEEERKRVQDHFLKLKQEAEKKK